MAYFFANDTSTDGIIQAGSFTTDGSGNANVNLGWEPQFIITKSQTLADYWRMFDTMRGWSDGVDATLFSNANNAEWGGTDFGTPTATGFTIKNLTASNSFVYLAIRKPNKPATNSTQMYKSIAYTGNATARSITGAGFTPDFDFTQRRTGSISRPIWIDRLRGAKTYLYPNDTGIEGNGYYVTSFDMDGVSLDTDNGENENGASIIKHLFRRSP